MAQNSVKYPAAPSIRPPVVNRMIGDMCLSRPGANPVSIRFQDP